MAISTLRKLLGTQYLRRGDGILSTPDARRKERLFGETGPGRLYSAGTGMKKFAEKDAYQPCDDTCLKAFVRLLATLAALSKAAQPL